MASYSFQMYRNIGGLRSRVFPADIYMERAFQSLEMLIFDALAALR